MAQHLAAITLHTETLQQTGEALLNRIKEQYAKRETLIASFREMAGILHENVSQSAKAGELAISASKAAESGKSVSTAASEAMGQIGESAGRITSIVDLIQEIAFQTNILALNAAVEAARAGEAGRGFAVVASEVRTLAQRSASALTDIRRQIADSQQHVMKGAQLVGSMSDRLNSISKITYEVAGVASKISTSGQQQQFGMRQVDLTSDDLLAIANTNLELTEEFVNVIKAVNTQINQLADVLSGQEDTRARYANS
jgi:methyl-accepting chemotaxis protein